MGGNTCSSSSGTAKNQRHGAFPAECRRYLDGFFVANVEKGWNMQKQKLHLESKITCVFVHIILPWYFWRKKQWLGPGSRCAFCFFQPPAPLWWANPCQSISTRRLRNIFSPRINGTKINGGTRAKSRGACGFTFLVGVHEEKTGRARKAQVWVPLQGFRFVGSQESRKQVKSENLKIHWNIIRGLF